MLVKNWMNRDVVTIGADDSMLDALELLKKSNIRMLPVMHQERLVGVVTDRDLKRASASDATTLEIHELLHLISKIKVNNIMSKDPITVPFDYTIEETAEILLANKISGMPVLDHQGRLLGTITQSDLFRALISLTGLSKRGIQFGLEIKDRPGSVKEVSDIIRNYGGRVASILSSYEDVSEGYQKIYIRIYDIDREKIPELKGELEERSKLLYMADLRENRREIY